MSNDSTTASDEEDATSTSDTFTLTATTTDTSDPNNSSSDASSDSCREQEIYCGGRCLDPLADGEFCGADIWCQGGEVCGDYRDCRAGRCVQTCSSGFIDCAGTCVDPQADDAWCGAQGHCDAASQGQVCNEMQSCWFGSCIDGWAWLPTAKLAGAATFVDMVCEPRDVRAFWIAEGQVWWSRREIEGRWYDSRSLGPVDDGVARARVVHPASQTSLLARVQNQQVWIDDLDVRASNPLRQRWLASDGLTGDLRDICLDAQSTQAWSAAWFDSQGVVVAQLRAGELVRTRLQIQDSSARNLQIRTLPDGANYLIWHAGTDVNLYRVTWRENGVASWQQLPTFDPRGYVADFEFSVAPDGSISATWQRSVGEHAIYTSTFQPSLGWLPWKDLSGPAPVFTESSAPALTGDLATGGILWHRPWQDGAAVLAWRTKYSGAWLPSRDLLHKRQPTRGALSLVPVVGQRLFAVWQEERDASLALKTAILAAADGVIVSPPTAAAFLDAPSSRLTGCLLTDGEAQVMYQGQDASGSPALMVTNTIGGSWLLSHQ